MYVLLPIFWALHKQKKKEKIQNTKKIQRNVGRKSKKIYQWEEHTRTPKKWSKTIWGGSKLDLIIYLLLMNTLLTKKI